MTRSRTMEDIGEMQRTIEALLRRVAELERKVADMNQPKRRKA